MPVKKRAILIAGPTASGKSEVAGKVGAALSGVIINADSLQVYEGLDIITAQPTPEETTAVPHALYGFLDPKERFSVADWLSLAAEAADEAWVAGQMPIFTGGTGLYFKGLIEGISDIPEVPEHVRLKYRKLLEKEGLPILYGTLHELDVKTAERLKPNDKQRILRALEVFEATGKPLSYWQEQVLDPALKGVELLKIVIEAPPEILNERIRERFKAMLDKGALKEAKAFQRREVDPTLTITKALGLRPLLKRANGEITLNEALELAVIETRQYAKRQRTWFRNQFADWQRVAAGPAAADKILFLAKGHFKD